MSSSSKWVQLPEELLTIIFLRLDLFPDRVRFGLVCKSWRCLQRHFARPPPLLLTSLWSNTSPPNCRLFDLFTQKLSVKLHLRLHEWPLQFSGPTNGFLLIRAMQSQDYFINPITNEKVYIPYLHHPWWEMRHVTISHAPNSTNCTVVVDGIAGLAMWRPGGTHWTWICTWTSPLEFFGRMIFYEEKLYVMRGDGYTLVYVFDPSPRMTELISPGVNYLQGKKVLVPLQFVGSNRELFIVLEVRNFDVGADSFGFQVFQLENGTKWKRISSLGDRFFLLSDFRSEAFSDKDFAGLGFQRNCIYLFKNGNSGVTVYSLEEERFLNSIPLLDERRAIDWLMPAVEQ